LQDLPVDTPEGKVPLYQYLATVCEAWGPNVGLVVAGNDEQALRAVRRLVPDAWLLAPGIGAQGGDVAAAVEAAAREDGIGILPVVSRAIAGAQDPGLKARDLRDQINAGRRKVAGSGRLESGSGGMRGRLLRRLVQQECFRVGSFRLKSGAMSPFYVDLRRIVSDPELLRLTARAYATLLRDVQFDRIAAVPVAAVPLATAVSLELGVPMVYPRMPAKPHGTGNAVEGAYVSGEQVVLLDDLITTGASKIEAVRILREQGLVVTDLVVLLERGTRGRQELAEHGVEVHAYAGIGELFAVCRTLGIIDDHQLDEMKRFARSG
jgi:uridine monophosphate synthetase